MLRILGWLLAVDIPFVIGSYLIGGYGWLLNTQIAFVSSSLVLAASAFSYSQMVYRRLESGTGIPEDDRDEIDKLEDPHALYADIDQSDPATLKEAIREEKQRMKQHRRSLLQTMKDSSPSLSLIRLGAYLLLFIGFFYLSGNRLLHIPSYLIGLSLPIVTVVALLLNNKKESNEAGI